MDTVPPFGDQKHLTIIPSVFVLIECSASIAASIISSRSYMCMPSGISL